MKRSVFVVLFVMVLFTQQGMLALAEGPAENVQVLEEMVVTGDKLVTPTKQTNETVYTGSEITRKGLDAQGNKATTSVYEAINVLPGVSVEGVDPFGLAARTEKHTGAGCARVSGGHDGVWRSQLRRQSHGASGIPLRHGEPGEHRRI